MSLAKYLAKLKSGAGAAGRAGMGLGALGAMKGVELASEHPRAAKALGIGAGGGALAAYLASHGEGGKGSQEALDEDEQRMLEMYPDMADDIHKGYANPKNRVRN